MKRRRRIFRSGSSLKYFLWVLAIVTLIDIIVVIKQLLPLLKRLSVFRKLKNDPDVITVEAEVLEIQTKKLNDFDTQYNVKVYYEIFYQKFYKDIVMINKQSLRTGMILTLLCSSTDPENVMINDGSEMFGIKSRVFNLVISVPVFITIIILQFLDIILAIGG